MNKRQRKRLRKRARLEALAVQQQQGLMLTQPGDVTISMDRDGATRMAPNSSQKLTQAKLTASYSFSGPLPPPELLAKYNDVVPNGAERIIKMAENQQTHRQDLERTVVHGNVASEKRGQWMGLTISVVVLAAGVYLAAIGRQAAGGAIAIADLATLAGVFVYGKHVQRQELEKKKEPFKRQ